MSDPQRPNILVILSDTHAPSAACCYGSPHIRTPNMDKLARHGVLFERAYCQSPLCLPSRASFLSGRYPFETGAIHNEQPYPDIYTIGHHLRGAGYETAALGKMHFIPSWEAALDQDRQRGFNRRVDFEEFYWYLRRERGYPPLPDQPDDPFQIAFLERLQHWLQAHKVATDEALHEYGNRTGTLPYEDHYEALILREWRAFLSEGHAQPFLTYVSFQAPHHPFIPTPEMLALYDDVEIPLPDPPDNLVLNHPYLRRRVSQPDRAIVERYLRYYAAFVTYMDYCIGQVLEALQQSSYADNTLVIYHSDHGEMGYQHGMQGKLLFYEDSVRVPMLMWWPDHVEGDWRYDGIVELIDLFPTLCDAAGVDTPDNLPGRSLLDDLRQRNGAGKAAAFSELSPMIGNRHEYNADRPTRMVVTQEWKLVQYGEDYANLFDLVNDPQEILDLSNDPAHSETLDDLRNMLHERMGETPPPEERLVNGFYEHQTGWYNRFAQPSPHHSRIPRLREEERSWLP